jgi:hypothetical protein
MDIDLKANILHFQSTIELGASAKWRWDTSEYDRLFTEAAYAQIKKP